MDETGGETVWTRLAALPTARVVSCLQAQAPQTVAALLLLFPTDRAADLLAGLPDELRARALRCMAVTRPPAPLGLAGLERGLRADLLDRPEPVGSDRSAEVARIVEGLPPEQRDAAREALRRPVPPLPPAEVSSASGAAPAGLAPSPGLMAMLTAREVVHDRLPMLEVVMDRFVRILSTSLRVLLDRPAEAGLVTLRSVRFGDWLSRTSAPLLAIVRAEPWDNHALLALHGDLLDGIGEVLLGGPAETAGLRLAGRAPTAIDRAFAEQLVEVALADLATAFGPIGAVAFPLDRLEDNPRFAVIDRLQNACFVADLTVTAEGRTGRFELLLPYATLEPVRDTLRRMFMGERLGKDPRWEEHLRSEVARAAVWAQAVAGTADLPLGQLLAWRSGTVVELDAGAAADAVFVVCGVPVARGALGRQGARWAIASRCAPAGSGGEPAVIPVALPEVEPSSPNAMPGTPSALHSVPVRVSAVVGGAELSLGEVPPLAQGGVVVLSRKVGDPVDLVAEGRVVARGNLVAVAGRLAVRLTEVAASSM